MFPGIRKASADNVSSEKAPALLDCRRETTSWWPSLLPIIPWNFLVETKLLHENFPPVHGEISTWIHQKHVPVSKSVSGLNFLHRFIFQLSEIKKLQKIISQLERKLGLESGSCLRLQMEKESLDESLLRLKLADSWDKRLSKSNLRGIGDGGFDVALTENLPARLVRKRILQSLLLL